MIYLEKTKKIDKMAITRTQIAKQILEQGGRDRTGGSKDDLDSSNQEHKERADRGYGDMEVA